MSSTEKCAVCEVVTSVASLRYNKCRLTGEWEYQCTNCRRLIKAGQLEH